MLGDKYRVVPHGCLSAVIGRFGSGQPRGYETPTMPENRLHAFISQILRFPAREPEPAAKFRPPESGEKLINITHLLSLMPNLSQ